MTHNTRITGKNM